MGYDYDKAGKEEKERGRGSNRSRSWRRLSGAAKMLAKSTWVALEMICVCVRVCVCVRPTGLTHMRIVWVWHDMRALCKMEKWNTQHKMKSKDDGNGELRLTMLARICRIYAYRSAHACTAATRHTHTHTTLSLLAVKRHFLFTHTQSGHFYGNRQKGLGSISDGQKECHKSIIPWFVIQYFVSRLTCSGASHLFAWALKG